MKLSVGTMTTKDGKDDWKGEQMVIESQDHCDNLLQSGYEITGTRFVGNRIEGPGNQMEMNVTIRMEKDGKQYIANADAISGYVMGLENLYDFQKKKPVFMPTPGGSVASDIEWAMMDIILDKYNKPLTERKLNTADPLKIHHIMNYWIEGEKQKLLSGQQSGLTQFAFIVNEKDEKITAQIMNKGLASLDDIDKIYKESENYDNRIILSFFYLTKKQLQFKDDDDLIFGIILYDLKNKNVLCFNLQSSVRLKVSKVVEPALISFNFIAGLFRSSIDSDMLCKSFIPLPVDSPYYTAMPWFSYAVLQGMKLDDLTGIPHKRVLSIAEFFVFGSLPFVKDASSFDFKPFSSKQDGKAICIMNFKDGVNLTYTLRFDQSKGEPLVHADYSFYDGKETKLIAHRPLDFESVQHFNQDLFVAMICAGLCDSYFTTIIEKGLSGVQDLIKKHPGFAYPLKWIWVIDTAIIWLNDNKEGYRILEKLHNKGKLEENDMEFVNKMFENNIELVAKDKNGTTGINVLGYMVLQRYKRGMTAITMS